MEATDYSDMSIYQDAHIYNVRSSEARPLSKDNVPLINKLIIQLIRILFIFLISVELSAQRSIWLEFGES
jgi:hypothetical protein